MLSVTASRAFLAEDIPKGDSPMPTLTQAAAAPAVASEAEEQLYRKVLKRILPLLLLCYVVAYLDRVNVGFAKLQILGVFPL
jgi:sugar phosphate permease